MSILPLLTSESAYTYLSWQPAFGPGHRVELSTTDEPYTVVASILSSNLTVLDTLELHTTVEPEEFFKTRLSGGFTNGYDIEEFGQASTSTSTESTRDDSDPENSVYPDVQIFDMEEGIEDTKEGLTCGYVCENNSACGGICHRCVSFKDHRTNQVSKGECNL